MVILSLHHIIREEHIKDLCPYCKMETNSEWKSHFEGKIHYKTIKCKCGKTNHINVDDGHEDI